MNFFKKRTFYSLLVILLLVGITACIKQKNLGRDDSKANKYYKPAARQRHADICNGWAFQPKNNDRLTIRPGTHNMLKEKECVLDPSAIVTGNQHTPSEEAMTESVASVKERIERLPQKETHQLRKAIRKKVRAIRKTGPDDTVPEATSGKSQIIALVLVLALGVLAIHRFYLGYIGIGILQLLTFGACGIWYLIDLVRIITGDLQPKDGPYSETL